MFCEKCGAQNPDNSAFCVNCGSPLRGGQGTGGQNPTILSLRSLAGGGLFLTCAIAFSVSLVFQLLASLRGASQLSMLASRLTGLLYQFGGYSYDPNMEMVENALNGLSHAASGGMIVSIVITMLPNILICVGLWMLFASAKGDGPGTGGLTLIRVICIINMIGTILGFLIAEVILILLAVALGNEYGGEGAAAIVVVIVLVLVVAILAILYQVKLVKTTGVMRKSIERGKACPGASAYVAVINFIGGGFMALGSLGSLMTMGPLSFVQSAAMATAVICFGVVIFSYNKQMNLVEQGIVPVVKQPAPQPYQGGVQGQWRESPPMARQNGYPPIAGGAQQWGGAAQNGYSAGGRNQQWGGVPQPPAGGAQSVPNNRPAPPETTVLSAADPAGGKMSYVVRVKTGERFPVLGSRFRIGRNYDSELCIQDNTVVGREHAEIVSHDGAFFLVDKNSSNHSYINQMELEPGVEHRLESGTEFVLGNEAFRFEM